MSLIELKLTPERMMYPKSEALNKNDFRIYACTTDSADVEKNGFGNISIKGIMQRLELGTEYTAQITLDKIDPKYGASYNVLSIYQDVPETLDGQREFLATLMTEMQLEEVYKTYPDADVIDLILNDKFDYKQVKYFGEKTYLKIKQRIKENIEFKDILSKYARFGITYEIITKLKTLLGSIQLATQKLDECPYILTKLNGFGFKRADKIARAMGVQLTDANRIEYGIRYTLEENEQQGHTFMYRDELLRSASEKLEVEEGLIEQILDRRTEELVFVEDKISLVKTYNAEKYIAERLRKMKSESYELNFNVDNFIDRMESKYNINLTHQQRDFFYMIKNNSVGVLVGFAGVGKSFMQKLTVELLEELNMTYTLLSPTGKAAKLLSKYTERKARTIHKAIGYGLDKDLKQLVEITNDFIIIDEMSMTDCFIMDMLLRKITNPRARILFCGDPAQLAAVGAANLLHDFVESGEIPVTMLDIVFRQKEGGLLDVITRIRRGEEIIPYNFTGKKVFGNDFIIHCIKQSEMPDGYKYYYDYFLKESAPKDITIITPTRKGIIGTVEINKFIQAKVNECDENKKEQRFGQNTVFRVGDYVINTQNMYDTLDYQDNPIDIVNGDTGVIIDIVNDKVHPENTKDSEEEGLKERDKNGIVIKFDSGVVRIDFENTNQLLHAWSMTTHRMQGSAAEYTISIADRTYTYQLSRNQLYTMLSRTRFKGVLLTQSDVFNRALKIVDNKRRNTFMQNLLQSEKEQMNEEI